VSATDREHLRDLASLHALGVASPAERAELAAAIVDDAELAAEVRALEDTAGALGGVVPQVDPPARLRARVLAVAGLEADAADTAPVRGPARAVEGPAVVRTRSSALPAWLAAAAAVVLASGLGLWALQLRSSLDEMNARVERAEQQVVEMQRTLGEAQNQTRLLQAHNDVLFAPDTLRVDLAGQATAPASTARAFVSRQSGMAFSANQLPSLPADKAYQLWVIPQGSAPVSAGLLKPDKTGHATLFYPVPAGMPPPAVIAVTVEPAEGVPAPTGDKVLVGSVTTAAG
jgi:anti-sigma-K factor RskA